MPPVTVIKRHSPRSGNTSLHARIDELWPSDTHKQTGDEQTACRQTLNHGFRTLLLSNRVVVPKLGPFLIPTALLREDSTTFVEIGRRVGVAPSTLYDYFLADGMASRRQPIRIAGGISLYFACCFRQSSARTRCPCPFSKCQSFQPLRLV